MRNTREKRPTVKRSAAPQLRAQVLPGQELSSSVLQELQELEKGFTKSEGGGEYEEESEEGLALEDAYVGDEEEALAGDSEAHVLAIRFRNLIVKSSFKRPSEQLESRGPRRLSVCIRETVWQRFKTSFEEVPFHARKAMVEAQIGLSQRTLLGIACIYEAPQYVLKLILDCSCKPLVTKDVWGRTPLLTSIIYNVPSRIISMLIDCDKMGDSFHLTDEKMKRNPLHAALEFGTDISVVQKLIDIDEGSGCAALKARDRAGLSPLDRSIVLYLPIQIVGRLVKASPISVIDSVLHCITKNENVGGIAQVPDHYFPSLAEKMVECPALQKQMEERISREPCFTFACLFDLYILILTLISYSEMLEGVMSGAYTATDEVRLASMSKRTITWLIAVFVFWGIGAVTKLFQGFAQGRNFLLNTWNWVDLIILSMVGATTIAILLCETLKTTVTAFIMATGFLLVLQLISRLRVMFLPFAIFVQGFLKTFSRMFPFMISTGLLLFGFAFLYRTSVMAGGTWCDEGKFGNDVFCNRHTAFGNVYFMFIMGINPSMYDIPEDAKTHAKIQFGITVIFSFLVQLFLLNVIIAIISDGWTNSAKEGSKFFWTCRLQFTAQTDAIFSAVEKLHLYNMEKHRVESSTDIYWESICLVFDPRFQAPVSASSYDEYLWYEHIRHREDIRQRWKLDKRFLPSTYADARNVFVVVVLRLCCALIASLWLIIGFASFGILLPYKVRKAIMSYH